MSMNLESRLMTHPVNTLRREIAKTNIKGYSKMKKSEVVELMMKPNNKPKFHHIKVKMKNHLHLKVRVGLKKIQPNS